MKNYYFIDKMNKQLGKRLMEQNGALGPLTLNLTENELIDSDVNQVHISSFDDAFHTIHNNQDELTGRYPQKSGEPEADDGSAKQKAYVDFDLFYTGLANARIAGQIDQAEFNRLNERSKD